MLIKMARTIQRAVLALVYPPHCLLCRTPLSEGSAGLCAMCWDKLELISGRCCPRCGCPQADRRASCGNCEGKVFLFSRMRAAAPFNASMQRLVHMLKYQGRTAVGPVLGRALGRGLGREFNLDPTAVVTPVPLYSSRQRERGYNQSLLIARAAARVLGAPVWERGLRRVRHTATQTALDLPGRVANVHGAFAVGRKHRVEGRQVVLIDDVVTTGATANACAEALLGAGAAEVLVGAAASPYFAQDAPGRKAI